MKLKPNASIKVQTPIIDSGMVTTGMMTERSEARNRKMTTITMITASPSVFSTSSIEDWMNLVES
ncbi:isopentenyl diphosphate isomerase/L-lactate dehydrogenase-like FMN-dependent dehydrogenase [Bradyrhizobium sp. i1.4.4]